MSINTQVEIKNFFIVNLNQPNIKKLSNEMSKQLVSAKKL